MDILQQLHFPDFAIAGTWISLLTLTFLEIVLGIDNIIFISILVDKLPASKQRFARNLGLGMALVFRLCLLLTIGWIISLKEPLFSLPFMQEADGSDILISWKDIILIAGGIFLIVKSTLEIHHKMLEAVHPKQVKEPTKKGATKVLGAIIIQIVLVDAVFSFDSILTAVGLVDNILLMMIAVIVSIIIMMLFSGGIARIINAQPTLQMLALSFLVVIGVILVADGIHQHVSKSIIYSCLAFSLAVEMLNIRLRKKQNQQTEQQLSENKDFE